MIRCVLCLVLAVGLWSCDERPTSTESTGRIVLEVSYGEERAAKISKVQAVDRMVATIRESGAVVLQQSLRWSGSRWTGAVVVGAGLYEVVLRAYRSGKVKWRGNALVSVRAGKTTTASLRMESVLETRFGFSSGGEIADWYKTENYGSWQIMNGRLLLEGLDTKDIMEAGLSTPFSGDIEISVETEWMDGIGGFHYGVLLHSTVETGYGFGISGNGTYVFVDWSSSGITNLIDPTPSSTIDQRGRNTLRVVTSREEIVLYINDTRVGSVLDPIRTQGLIGLYVGHMQKVAFDNLDIVGIVSIPGPPPTYYPM